MPVATQARSDQQRTTCRDHLGFEGRGSPRYLWGVYITGEPMTSARAVAEFGSNGQPSHAVPVTGPITSPLIASIIISGHSGNSA
jgi:hypothetical protein